MTDTEYEGGTGFDFDGLDLDDSDFFENTQSSTSKNDSPPILPGTEHPDLEDEDPLGGSQTRHGTGEYDEPDASAVGGQTRRPRGALTYEKRLRQIFATLIKTTAQRHETAPDSAALILYSPKVAKHVGELAAHDPRVARGIDMIYEGTENPYLNAIVVAAPLFFQLVRNHEPVLEPRVRGIKIPFLKTRIGLPFKLGVKLGMFRNLTDEPASVANWVFSEPKVQEAFRRQDVKIGWTIRR